MRKPRRGWFPLFVDCLLAAVVVGFVIFVAAVYVTMHGCTVVNVAAGESARVEGGDKGAVVIRPKGKE
jgi:hypothetical protein